MYQHYNTNQMSFVLNFDFDIDPHHEARFIDAFVNSIPSEILLEKTGNMGRPAFHPAMLLKVCLFAYSRQVYSGRKMVQMNEEMIPMKWLTRDTSFSYKTINNFRSSAHANKLIKECFIYFTLLLQDKGLLEDKALFIDGTKLEADANKYSFTWRRATEKFEGRLHENIEGLYDELIQENVNLALKKEDYLSVEGLEEMAEAISDTIDQLNVAIEEEEEARKEGKFKGASLKKKQRRHLKSRLHKIRHDYQPRQAKYDYHHSVFNGRHSFSKTDTDATFMRMKEDPMKNGQLKPGYNLQAATNGRFVLSYGLFPNPNDTRTLIPFLESMSILEEFDYIVADAGYGSEQNYSYVIDQLEKTPLIPYGTYEKEKTRRYKNDPESQINWEVDEINDKITRNGVHYHFKHYSQRKDSYGMIRDFKIYEADSKQDSDELTELSKTPNGNQRQIHYNPTWDYFKHLVKEELNSEEGALIYAKRKIDVETVFGDLKGNFGVRRVHLRGKEKVETDIGMTFMAMNLKKLRRVAIQDSTSSTTKPWKEKESEQRLRKIEMIFLPFCSDSLFWTVKFMTFFPAPFFYEAINRMNSLHY
jgi:transposase